MTKSRKKTRPQAVPASTKWVEPYLVQRLRPATSPNATGVDAVVACEYMGSSEFEWGATHNALQTMRANIKDIGVYEIMNKRDNPHRAYMVGRAIDRSNIAAWFARELEDGNRLKEPARLAQAYGTNKSLFRLITNDTVGWWALDQAVPWALFMHLDTAHRWFAALTKGK